MDPQEREKLEVKLVEDMLGRGLRRNLNPGGEACPAPDVLAAYSEDQLSAPEKERLEAHLADCWRCQEALAAIALSQSAATAVNEAAALPADQAVSNEAELQIAAPTAKPGLPERFAMSAAVRAASSPRAPARVEQTVLPQDAASARPGRKAASAQRIRFFWRWGWAVPAAAAAVLALWFGVFRPHEPPRLTEVAVKAPAPPNASPALATQPAANPAYKAPEIASPAASRGGQRAAAAKNKSSRTDAGSKKASAAASQADDSARRAAPPASAAKPASGSGTGAAGAGTPNRAQAGKEEEDAATRRSAERAAAAQAGTAGAAQSGGTVPAASQQVAVQGAPSAAPPTPPPAESRRAKVVDEAAAPSRNKPAGVGGVALGRVSALAAAPKAELIQSRPHMVPTPDPAVFWRVGPAGLIERSQDAGHTWQPQLSGVSTDLVAGYAPSTKVCWVVGAEGAILRTTDGEHWEKIAAPIQANWVRILATDADEAVITSAEGKQYVTTNGGRTWK